VILTFTFFLLANLIRELDSREVKLFPMGTHIYGMHLQEWESFLSFNTYLFFRRSELKNHFNII
jgi:hypothetical protein